MPAEPGEATGQVIEGVQFRNGIQEVRRAALIQRRQLSGITRWPSGSTSFNCG